MNLNFQFRKGTQYRELIILITNNMKTIGLLTFHFPTNYGALLQTYALKTYLESLNFEVHVINYYSDKHKKKYNFFNNNSNIKAFISNIVRLPFYFNYKIKNKKFDKFRQEHFNLTERFRNKEEIDFS